jgi:hypothetical protein
MISGQYGQQAMMGVQPPGMAQSNLINGQQPQGMGVPYSLMNGQRQPQMPGYSNNQMGMIGQFGQQQTGIGGQYGQLPGGYSNSMQGQFGQQQHLGAYSGGMQQQQQLMYPGQTPPAVGQQPIGQYPQQQQSVGSPNVASFSGGAGITNQKSSSPVDFAPVESPQSEQVDKNTVTEPEVPLLEDVPAGYGESIIMNLIVKTVYLMYSFRSPSSGSCLLNRQST